MPIRYFAFLLLLASSWVAPPVSAAPAWTPHFVIPTDGVSQPSFGFADGGVEFAARVIVAMPIDIHNASTQLIVSRKPPGGPSVDELVIGSTTSAVPSSVSIAVAPSGAAVVAFAEGTTNDFSPAPPVRWRAVYRSPSGAWEAPVTLFSDPIATPSDVETNLLCAIAPDGTAVAGAAHVEPDDSPSEPPPGQPDGQLDLAIHPASGAWQSSQRLSVHNESVDFGGALGVDDAGNFTVAWASRFSEGATNSTSDDRHTLLVRRRLSGQSIWNATEDVTGSDITKDAFFTGPGFAVGPDGHAVISFQYGPGYKLWGAARSDSAHTFSGPQQIVTTGASSAPSAAGVAPDGAAYVLYEYQGSSSGLDNVGMLKLPPGGAWTSEAPVSPLDFSGSGGGIAFRGNDALAVWAGNNTAMTIHLIEASRWPAGAGTPEAYVDLEQLGSNGSVQQVVSDRAGSVLATWLTGSAFHAAAFDGGGPSLASSAIPGRVIAGVAATFSATFADLWSTIPGSPSWDFGDGTPAASGGTVAHTFAAPGTFTVTATATDALGNPGASMFSVSVAECEALTGVDSVLCRCSSGLAIAACAGQTLPQALTNRFAAACGAVHAAQAAGHGKKGRKAAGHAVKGFKKVRSALGSPSGKKLVAECRNGLSSVLTTARANAAAFKSTL